MIKNKDSHDQHLWMIKHQKQTIEANKKVHIYQLVVSIEANK